VSFRAIEHQVKKNLDPSLLTPFNSIDEYQRFASALAYSTNTPPNTRIHDNGMKITFKDHTLDVELWRKGLTGLVDRITRNLNEICYHRDFGSKVPERVPDDWSNTDRSYGWTENAEFVPDKLGLLQHMLKDEELQLAKVDREGKLELKSAAMWKFLDRSATINRDLAALCFFVNGQNTRISEFVEHKIRNSIRPRTCFYDDHTQCIWLVTRRLKTKQETFVPLKCPPVVTELMRKYLTIVRPVEEHLAFHVRGTEARSLYQEFLFVQNCALMQKQTMYNLIPDFLESSIQERIGIHDYRQITVEMRRCFLGSEYEMEREELDTLAAQGGHSEITAQTRYASEVGHLPGLPSELLLRFGRSSEGWWHLAGLKRDSPPLLPLRTRQEQRNVSKQPSETTGSKVGEQASIKSQDLVAIMQNMFLTMETSLLGKMKEMLSKSLPDPARLESKIKEMVTTAIDEFRHQKDITHPFGTTPPFSASEPSSVAGNETFDQIEELDPYEEDIYEDRPITAEMIPPPLVTIETQAAIAEYHPTTETKDYLHHLLRRHFPGKADVTFKSSMQMQAVDLALSREENFVLVMPTGSGKSLVFTLPPFNEESFRTYVVTPNKALLNDHIERCRKIGLDIFHWTAKDKGVPEETQIVFMALESATSQTFRE